MPDDMPDPEEYNASTLESIMHEFESTAEALEEFRSEIDGDVTLIEASVDECVAFLEQGYTPLSIYSIALSSASMVSPERLAQAMAAMITRQAEERFIKGATRGISPGS